MKVVFDTNIFISFLLSSTKSPLIKVFYQWRAGNFTVLLRKAILKEITQVLTSQKILKLTKLSKVETKQYLKFIVEHCLMIKPHSELKVIQADPSDNKFLNLAIDGQAKLIISGDKHLLNLKKFKKCKILSPQQFISTL